MNYLLDTNIISETVKVIPNPCVINWLSRIPNHHLAISVLTLGEIRKGAEKLSNTRRKAKITQWLEIELIAWFHGRVISIDERVADKWGYISAYTSQLLPAIDGLIAACALVHDLKLVTRNVKDFEKIPGLEVFNPWEFFG